jgi:hypothetical protein
LRYDSAARAQANTLGCAIASLAGDRITGLEWSKIERANALLLHARAALSDFEADLVEQAAERLRSQGLWARVTEKEWHVIDTAIDAMDDLLAGVRRRG